MESDSVLISRVQAGDPEALATLYERYLPSVWRYVYSRLGREAASQDVVSETFLAMVQGIARLDPPATNLAKWLTAVARNKVADHWRQSTAQAARADLEAADRRANPGSSVDVSEVRQAVGRAMDRLDDLERVALEWKYIDGLSVRQIAGRLGRTEKAVEAILYRARAAFKAEYNRNTQ